MYSEDKCLCLLKQNVKSAQLLKHSLAVGAAMYYYAEYYSDNPEYWRAVGLLHDIDFEKFPEEHCRHTAELLKPAGYTDRFIEDIVSHQLDWESERSMVQKALAACDEMSGFIIACSLVRPDKSLAALEVKSVIKKMKDKTFARAVNRDDLKKGAEILGIALEAHIENVQQALAKIRAHW